MVHEATAGCMNWCMDYVWRLQGFRMFGQYEIGV